MSDDSDLRLPHEREARLIPTVVSDSSDTVAKQYRIIRFRGRAMLEVTVPYPHFVPLHKEAFDRIAYPILGGVSRTRVQDVFAYLGNTAEDLTGMEHLVGFGVLPQDLQIEASTDLAFIHKHRPAIWDMKELAWIAGEDVAQCVWRSPYSRIAVKESERLEFVMQLAGGNENLYDDIMQSIAPLVMYRKPDGVVWWVGDGANGKSTLMDALYKIFPSQLSSITVKRLTDGRDTPSLNGTLANIVKETSEGRVDDSEIYKNIGTHENFRVHKFHSQDDIEIRGNLHHVFSANQIPSFNDKGYAARRRTFVIPFKQRFESDPSFEDRTFTPELFGRLISEMCKYAQRIKNQGYRYKWSAVTLAAKASYDAEASNAEEYLQEAIADGLAGFDSFNPLRVDYENWCADNGYVPLGITNLRRATQALGFERISVRDEGNVGKRYILPHVQGSELQPIGLSRPGLFTVSGFEKPPEPKPEPTKLEIEEEPKPKQSILKGGW